MPHARFERRIADLLAEADVRIGGNRPWDIQVHDPRFHARVLGQGSLGLGESYMDGWWDAASLDGLLFHLLVARVDERYTSVEDEHRLRGVKRKAIDSVAAQLMLEQYFDEAA